MLVELAIGDAYAFSFEMAHPEFVLKNNDVAGYIRHPSYPIKLGHYSDDTQLSIAIAEMLLSNKPKTAVELARLFVYAFKRDPRQGYSRGFYDILTKVRNGTDLLMAVDPRSRRSGGCMRAAPCGYLSTVDAAINMAVWQASITHGSYEGMMSAGAIAAIVWACRNGCDLGYLSTFLNDVIPVKGHLWDLPWKEPVPNEGFAVVRAVLTVLMGDTKSMEVMLQDSVELTGDTDTVASLVMAAASVHPGIDKDLPKTLYDDLENGKYGRAYLEELDRKLEAAFPLSPVLVEQEIEMEKPPAVADGDSLLGMFFGGSD